MYVCFLDERYEHELYRCCLLRLSAFLDSCRCLIASIRSLGTWLSEVYIELHHLKSCTSPTTLSAIVHSCSNEDADIKCRGDVTSSHPKTGCLDQCLII